MTDMTDSDTQLNPTTVPDEQPTAERERIACDIASGTARDPSATAITIRGAWREVNSRGSGGETYRRALSPGGRWRFVSSERLPRGTFLASDRKAVVRGDVFAGDLLADFERGIRAGSSTGEARHDGKIGLVIGTDENKPQIEWMDVSRQKDGTWRIVLPTGAHLSFPPAGWR